MPCQFAALSGESPLDHMPQGLQHPECYARALGGCSRQMSGEHYISECVLELVFGRGGEVSKSVLVAGLSFQKPGELRPFGIASLVGNILCERHNSLLSPFDSAGKAMFSAMDGMNDGAEDPSLPKRILRVNGDDLERWVLKSMCGGLYSGAFRVNPTKPMSGTVPPLEWLHILFSGAEFPPGQGLYYIPKKPGETVTSGQYVLRFEPIGSHNGGEIGGPRIWFLGFEFALLMENLMPGVPSIFDGALYRPAGLQAVESGTSVRIDWKGGARSDKIVFGLAKREPLGT